MPTLSWAIVGIIMLIIWKALLTWTPELGAIPFVFLIFGVLALLIATAILGTTIILYLMGRL